MIGYQGEPWLVREIALTLGILGIYFIDSRLKIIWIFILSSLASANVVSNLVLHAGRCRASLFLDVAQLSDPAPPATSFREQGANHAHQKRNLRSPGQPAGRCRVWLIIRSVAIVKVLIPPKREKDLLSCLAAD